MNSKKAIIEQHANNLKAANYPNAAGKIIGLLYISNQKYFTFEEIMNRLEISKSATSKALNFLLNLGRIKFKFKDGNKRKRYFYFSIEGHIEHLNNMQSSYYNQIKLLKETLKYKDENMEISKFIKQQIAFLKDIIPYIESKYLKHFTI